MVLFDLGDVIARWDPIPRLEAYGRRAGLSPDEVRARLATGDFWHETDRGSFTSDRMAERICELLGCAFSRGELLRLQALAFEVRPEIVQIAREAANAASVGILTNNAPLLRDAFPIHFPELVRCFAPILFSFEFGHTKPDARLFEAVTSSLGRAPAEIVFCDDQPQHVAAARSAGWDAFRFESARQLRAELDGRGLIRAHPA